MSDVIKLTDMGVPAVVVSHWMGYGHTGVTSDATLPRGVVKIEPYPDRPGDFVVFCKHRDDLPSLVMATASRVVQSDDHVVKDRYEVFGMVRCDGCGFHVERRDAYGIMEADKSVCERCVKCDGLPDMRESYRRGFNAGLDAMAAAVKGIAENSNLRKRKDGY